VGAGSGTMTSVKEGGALVGTADAVAIDFGAGFDVSAVSTDRDVTLDFSEAAPTLDQVGDPGASKTFGMGTNSLKFTFPNTTAAEAFEINATGNFNQDLLHIHQHQGNPTAGNIVVIEWEDKDMGGVMINVDAPDDASGLDVVGITITSDDNDDSDYVPLLIQDDSGGTPDTLAKINYQGLITSAKGISVPHVEVTTRVEVTDLDGAIKSPHVIVTAGLEVEDDDNIIGKKEHLRFNIFDPNTFFDTDANLSLWPRTEASVTITEVIVTTDTFGEEVFGNLNYADEFINKTSAVQITDFNTTGGSRGTAHASTVPAGKVVYITFDADPSSNIEQLNFDIWYRH